MPALESVELRTPRLTLRPLVSQDVPQLFDIHADPAVMKYSNSPAWTRVEQATELVDANLKWLTSGIHICLGIVRTGPNEVVGTCTLFDIDRSSQRAELGFVLASHVWRQGYMTEALTALLGFAFDSLLLNRIDADTDPRNAAATRLLERLRFRREGLLRERWIVGTEKSDAALYGLLRSDWLTSHGQAQHSVA
jgi:[ribosomal protein S5]-alanine N-acetyltransferase